MSRRPKHASRHTAKRVPQHVRDAREQLDTAFASLRLTDPDRYAEQLALTQALAKRADYWRTHEIRLPRGVQLVPMLDEHDRRVLAIDWGCDPPPCPPTLFQDRAIAVETVWTVFMLRRPWAIDDDRLSALVEHPPVPRARLLGELLSIRVFDWLRRSFSAFSQACIDDPPEQGLEALAEAFAPFVDLMKRYQARAELSLHALYELLDVAEPDADMRHELACWRCMLLDYTEALDAPLHEHLLTLAERFEPFEHQGVRDTWNRVLECRQLDGCLGLLLARATMLDPSTRPSLAQGYVDPMSTRAVGSFAWWCRITLDACDDEYDLGDRLQEEQIHTFVGFALHRLGEISPGLAEELVRVFPLMTE
ncbi:hypothetical protein [Paraliomyxa miuraensis]|uniref:hypothetical protein n=1 Tax=Paraliomyxa miuraensis TaxID=376150 RepID=UPI002259FB32|nr:hypothetical protein [Paraliomyxa miuraensis]MCX4239396.1 hypothetical protein [Paraliomyxa miuraensis]